MKSIPSSHPLHGCFHRIYRSLACLLHRWFEEGGEPTAPRRGAYRPTEHSLVFLCSFLQNNVPSCLHHPAVQFLLTICSPNPRTVRDDGRRETGSGVLSLQTTSSTLKRMNGNHTARKSVPPPNQKGKERRKTSFFQSLGWAGLAGREERVIGIALRWTERR